MKTIAKRAPEALKLVGKSWWMVFVLVAAANVCSMLVQLSVSVLPQVLLVPAVVLVIQPVLLSALYALVYFVVAKQSGQTDAKLGAFFLPNWLKFYAVSVCYAVISYGANIGFRLLGNGFISDLSMIFSSLLALAQLYTFAFVIGTKENRVERRQDAWGGLGIFLVIGLVFSVASWLFAKGCGALQWVVAPSGDVNAMIYVLIFVRSTFDFLLRYFAIVYFAVFLTGPIGRGDLAELRALRDPCEEQVETIDPQ